MRVRLRLQRFGRKKAPFYRIVAAPSAFKRDGRFLEIIGLYHPTLKETAEQVRLDEEKVLAWLNKGASPSETVKQILSGSDIWAKHMEEASRRKQARGKKKSKGKKQTAVAGAASGKKSDPSSEES